MNFLLLHRANPARITPDTNILLYYSILKSQCQQHLRDLFCLFSKNLPFFASFSSRRRKKAANRRAARKKTPPEAAPGQELPAGAPGSPPQALPGKSSPRRAPGFCTTVWKKRRPRGRRRDRATVSCRPPCRLPAALTFIPGQLFLKKFEKGVDKREKMRYTGINR